MRNGSSMSPLENYIDAWVAGDPDRIASAVTEDCEIIECYGPVYRGRDRVHQWAAAWFGAGGVVHRWKITDSFRAGEHEAAQWVFDFTWRGRRRSFDGSTITTSYDGRIHTLREYRTTAELYEWTGEWR